MGHKLSCRWDSKYKLPVSVGVAVRSVIYYCFAFFSAEIHLFTCIQQMLCRVQYGAAYESAKFLGNTADALTMLGYGMIFMLTMDGLLPSLFYASFHGQALVFMLLYLWSKNSPSTQVSFFGVIKFQSLYLPFALFFIDVLQGANPMHGIRGILAGHMYYFLTEIYPSTSGRHLISTPLWLSRLVYRYGLGKVPVQQVRPEHPSSAGFRAFIGRSHRLS